MSVVNRASLKEIQRLEAENARLRDALEKAEGALERLTKIASVVTIRQVVADDDLINATGLNPWCMNEGLASGDEQVDLSFAESALAAIREVKESK